MNEIFEKIYNDNNTDLNESSALFEKVYTEAEMLNEMNPKLRALLAAGLIGTAGLGAVSCSMPTDDPSDVQYTIEQPTPENPEEIEEIEDSEDSEEIGDNGGEETVTEAQKQLNTLLEIIDYNGLREEMTGARYYPNQQRIVKGNSLMNSLVISVSGIAEPSDENGLADQPAYCFGKASQEGCVNLYWVLKTDYPDLNPDAFLAAL